MRLPDRLALPLDVAQVGLGPSAQTMPVSPDLPRRLAALDPHTDRPDRAELARGEGPEQAPRLKTEAPEPVKRMPERAQTPPPGRPVILAAGQGGGAVAGRAATPVQTEVSTVRAAAPDPALIARWGARIGARIEARKRTPGGNWAPGKAVVRLTVARDGTVQSVSLVQSAGDTRLDRAALSAVSRAGRMPAAPKGLNLAEARFDIPAAFTR